jgi:hypothetical protein
MWSLVQLGRVIEKVDSLIERGSDAECWPWRGSLNRDGAGVIQLFGKNYLAHRLVWELSLRRPAAGLQLRRACGKPACVNPLHLVASSS